MSARSRQSNILGAAALAISDRMLAATESGDAPSPSAIAAISALHQFLEGGTLDQLGRVLGLSHSGAVRLADRLCEEGLATRGPGDDRRSRRLHLTTPGAKLAEEITAARLRALDALTAGFSAAERQTLADLLSRVLANVVMTKEGGGWTCRMCSLSACERDKGRCPAANAAAQRFTQS